MMCDSKQHLINRTTVFCFRCESPHEAEVRRDGERIIGRVHCPISERAVELSSNAEMFLAIRAKSRRMRYQDEPGPGRSLVNLLSITDHCNCRCPVCYASAGPQEHPSHLPVNKVAARVHAAKQRGATQVSLTGGEPTLHPDLPDIVKTIRKMGVKTIMATNGLRLAEDSRYAETLKKHGLWKVNLQLDAFDKTVHQQIRGNTLVDEKIRAAGNVVAAGLRLGIITTVTELNLPELGRIAEFGLSLAPTLSTIVFQAATTAGRFALPENTVVDRERIIQRLLDSGVLPNATVDDVWPLPSYQPWGMRVHPDCGVNVILGVDDGKCDLLPRMLDIDALYRRMGRNTMRPHWIARNLVPLYYMLSAARRGKRIELLKHLAGFLLRSKRRGVVVIGIGSFLTEGFWDEQRSASCAASELTKDGPISPCIHHSPMKKPCHQFMETEP